MQERYDIIYQSAIEGWPQDTAEGLGKMLLRFIETGVWDHYLTEADRQAFQKQLKRLKARELIRGGN